MIALNFFSKREFNTFLKRTREHPRHVSWRIHVLEKLREKETFPCKVFVTMENDTLYFFPLVIKCDCGEVLHITPSKEGLRLPAMEGMEIKVRKCLECCDRAYSSCCGM
jgi:hypothetical protein